MGLTLDLTKRYTYADYLTWLDDVRRELIDGFVSMMSAPSWDHAVISNNIVLLLNLHLLSKKCECKVFHAPFDVLLPNKNVKNDDKIYTVVQPDICVICDLSKKIPGGYRGAPDMIVEILSPSTKKKDRHKKYDLYEKAGVREYWIANPKNKTITAYVLQNDGQYDDGEDYIIGEKAPVHIFDGYAINLEDIFKE